MLNVTHRHVFISQQVNDPRRSRRRRRCGQPAMQQSAGLTAGIGIVLLQHHYYCVNFACEMRGGAV